MLSSGDPVPGPPQRARPWNTMTLYCHISPIWATVVSGGGEHRRPRPEWPGDGLGLGVLLEAFHPVLAAYAAGLVPAERRVGAVPDASVDRSRAGPDAPGHGQSPGLGGGRDAEAETVLTVVGQADGVVVVVEGDDHQDRAEDLLPRHPHGVVHPGDQGGLHVVALVQVGRAPAADDDPGPLLAGRVDERQDPLPLPGVDLGALQVGGVGGVAIRHRPETGLQYLDALVVSGPGQEETGQLGCHMAPV